MLRSCQFVSTILLVLFVMVGMQAEPAQATSKKLYVALGDSITAAEDGAPGDRIGYVDRYADALGDDYRVRNLGVSGWTSRDLLRTLQRREGVRESVRRADVLTIYIGTNDILTAHRRYVWSKPRDCGGKYETRCLKAAVNRFHKRYESILRIVSRLRGGDMDNVAAVTVYQPFVATSKRRDTHPPRANDFRTVKLFYDALNRRLEVLAARQGVDVVDVRRIVNGRHGRGDGIRRGMLLQRPPDGVHPTNKGHRAVAQALM